jgi:hypothetical protein
LLYTTELTYNSSDNEVWNTSCMEYKTWTLI